MIDLLIVLAFVAYSIASGFRAKSNASKNLNEYFLAGKTVKGWKAGFSMAATQYAADTPLLVTGLIATGGIFMLWRLWIYGLAFLMIGFVLGRAWRNAGVLTDAELTEIRYSGRGVTALRGLKAIYYGTVINCTVMAMVLVAANRISETFLLWHEWLPENIYGKIHHFVQSINISFASGATDIPIDIASTNNLISILLIVGFTTLYSTTGGLRTVINTDVVQFIIAMTATLVYAVYAVVHVGGLGSMTKKLVSLYGTERTGEMLSFGPHSKELLMPFLIIVGLQWFFQMNSDGTGYLAQRTMACRSDRDARMAGFVFTVAQVLVRSLFWLPICIALLLIYPFDPTSAGGETFTASREILFATGIKDLMPAGVRGLMLTGLFAALASTISTHLNWGASYWSNDIYYRIINQIWLKRTPRSRELVVVARFTNILILVIALAIMVNLDSIQTAWYISLLFGAGMGAVLVLRWLWERINIFSELAAIVASLVFAPIILFTVKEEYLRLLLMSVISTAVVLIVTWLTPETDEHILNKFYERVKPPGFWKKTALKVGADPKQSVREFQEGVYLVLTTGATVFLLLIGIGKLLLPSPNESSFFHWLILLAGLASIGLWWRKIFGKSA